MSDVAKSQPLAPIQQGAVPNAQHVETIGGGTATPSSNENGQRSSTASKTCKKRGRRRSSLPRPRLQGDIDGLCGFYTVINALRLAFASHGGLSATHEYQIWCRIVRYADRKWRFASLYLGGIFTYQFLAVARLAVKTAQKLTGKRVVIKPLLKREVAEHAMALAAIVSSQQDKGHSTLLAGIDSKHTGHWTVIAGVSTATLRVIDSDGLHFLKLDGCRLDGRHRPKGSARYWVRIYGALVVLPPVERRAAARGRRHG